MSFRTKIQGFREVWRFDNRLSLVFTKAFFPRETLHLYRYKGIEFLTDHSAGDANGARELFTSPMYRRFFSAMDLPARLNVLDLGASNGGFPLLLLSEGLELKKLVSVEFNPNTFHRLQFNLARNLKCDFTAINAAVCGKSGMIDVKLGSGGTSDNIFEGSESSQTAQFTIKGYTFDELYREAFEDETVDICKMDIEGAEFEIFETDHHAALSRCRYLIMEIHERFGGQAADILSAVESLEFDEAFLESGGDPTVHLFVNRRLQGGKRS